MAPGVADAVVGGHPDDLHPGVVAEPAGPQRLGDRQVGVRQVDVLADDGDPHGLRRVVHPFQQLAPHRPVDVMEAQVQPAHHVGVQPLAVQHPGDVVDRRRIGGGDHRLGVDVAHQRDLALERLRDVPVGPADQRVRLDADVAQRRHRMLGWLGLQLAGRCEVGHQRDVQEEHVVAADVVPDLPGGLQERQRLDVADRAADLGDHHVGRAAIGIRLGHRPDPVLDFVGDVRDDLDGVAEVLAAPFPGDHPGVDLAGGDVRLGGQVPVQEPLVMPDVQVGLRAVLGDEHLAVLERVHGAGVDVDVGVQLLHGDPQAARGEQPAEAGGGQSLAQGRGDAAGDEDVLGDARRLRQSGSRVHRRNVRLWSVTEKG